MGKVRPMLWRIGETLLILAAVVAFVVFAEGGDWGGVLLVFVVFGLIAGFEKWRGRRVRPLR